MIRTLLALFTGFLTFLLLFVMANAVVFHGAPSPATPALPLQALLLAMTGLAAIVGGNVAAAIGRRHPMGHAFMLGLCFVAASVARVQNGLVDQGPAVEPLWFSVAVTALAFIGAVLGGAMRRQMAPDAARGGAAPAAAPDGDAPPGT